MDVFYEQIVGVKKTAQKKALCAIIYILAVAVSALAVLGALKYMVFMFLFVILIALTWFLAFKLISNFNIEYEYIITNGDLDVDLIINKSRRKRIATIQCKNIESVKKYDPTVKASDVICCCNADDEAYLITARGTSGKVIKLVIAPNEKIKDGITKFLSRIISKDAFI